MPVKRRRPPKQRPDYLSVWEMSFETGWDFFSELEPFGIITHEQLRAAAPEAWDRFGDEFLAKWTPTASQATPWAIEEFGPPNRTRTRPCH